jgi:COPII coat assembly protein SEC16
VFANISPEIEKSVKEIFLPQVATTEEPETFGVTASSLALSATAQATLPDPTALATYNLTTDFLRSMRTSLLQGDRQGAIRKAVDHKMWGHALLVAGSVSPIVWRDAAEQFIRSELRDTVSTDFDSLRFLYGVLGGEGSDAVNELLPPTNRMISSVNATSAAQAPRFSSWKESLGMALQNSGSAESCSAALVGLGTALVNHGRIEAGHSWFAPVCQYVTLVSC